MLLLVSVVSGDSCVCRLMLTVANGLMRVIVYHAVLDLRYGAHAIFDLKNLCTPTATAN